MFAATYQGSFMNRYDFACLWSDHFYSTCGGGDAYRLAQDERAAVMESDSYAHACADSLIHEALFAAVFGPVELDEDGWYAN